MARVEWYGDRVMKEIKTKAMGLAVRKGAQNAILQLLDESVFSKVVAYGSDHGWPVYVYVLANVVGEHNDTSNVKFEIKIDTSVPVNAVYFIEIRKEDTLGDTLAAVRETEGS